MEISIIPNKQIPTIPNLFSQTSSSSSSRCCCFIIHSIFPHHNSYNSSSNLSSSFLSPPNTNRNRTTNLPSFQLSYRRFYGDEGEDEETHQKQDYSFNEAVELFNKRDYYTCHDFLEHLWNEAQDPTRTLYHAILQCAVGFHHLFNQNHRGAMMELGEGLCKLRKMNFETGPFLQFEQEISAALDFVYQTQLELAACTDDLCLTMDQTERSYQLLGGYAAGQRLYCLVGSGPNDRSMYIVFCPERSHGSSDPPRVKLPTLHATEEHLTVYI